MKTLAYFIAALAVLVAGFYAFNSYIYNEKQGYAAANYKEAEYTIDGRRVRLEGAVTYFGNEVRKDLDGDGREDIAFIVTAQPGGSGTFYYVVAAINTERGYVGSEALLLGDRIAPQTTESGPGKQIIVNYAVRNTGEPFTTPPSVGKSLYLLLDKDSMQFGEVVQNFEGEADPSRMSLTMKSWVWQGALYNDGTTLAPKKAGVFTLTFGADGHFSATTDCNSMGGSYVTSGGYQITLSDIYATKKFCAESQESDFAKLLGNAAGYLFTSKGELVLDLKYDSGTATFR